MTASPDETAAPAAVQPNRAKIAGSLLRYRILAWATGIWLLFLTSELIARYGFDVENYRWVEPVHGWVYLAYAVFTVDLAIKVRWPWLRTIGTLIAGTIPFLSFAMEHHRTGQVRRDFGV